jgi:hypothetical protein
MPGKRRPRRFPLKPLEGPGTSFAPGPIRGMDQFGPKHDPKSRALERRSLWTGNRRCQDERRPGLRRPRNSGPGRRADLDRWRQRRNLLTKNRCVGGWTWRYKRWTRSTDPGLRRRPARIAARKRHPGKRLVRQQRIRRLGRRLRGRTRRNRSRQGRSRFSALDRIQPSGFAIDCPHRQP